MLKHLSVVVLITSIAVSCGDASFFGGGKGSDRNSNQTPTNQNQTPNGGTNPNGTNPNGTNPNGTNPNGTNPPVGTGPGWTPNGSSTIPNPDIRQPTPNQIIFGENKFFHIGDNQFLDTTNCAGEIKAYDLVGSKYFFEFIVTQANTTLNFASVRKVCGIDNETSNFASIGILGVRALQSFKMTRAMNNTEVKFTQQVLQPGNHMIIIDSMANQSSNAQMADGGYIALGDHDDFLVGNILIDASAPITPGRVGTLY